MMTIEERSISVQADDGIHPAQLYISLEHPWSLRLVVAGEEFEAHENDLFGCLTTLRRALEDRGWRICCAGSLDEVYPSGMSRQMGGGRLAYRHEVGRQASHADLVDIFDPVDCNQVGTIASQEKAVYDRRR